MRTLPTTLAACLIGGAAFAQECVTIDNDLDRLACYDRESGRTPKVEVAAAPSGKWRVREETSEFKDTTDVYISVNSDETVRCSDYNSPGNVRLLIRCRENTTAIMLQTGCHVTSGYGNYGKIEYRIDDRKAKTRSFVESTNNKTLGLWYGNQSIPMIKELFGGDRLLMRFTAYNQSATTARFTITGLEEAIKPLRKECGW